jgi:EmrB/QacA subfamily drug resistance transporter
MSATAATGSATVSATPERSLTHKQILTILTGLLLGMFLAALDQTIVATAIRRIGDDLNGLSVQAWVTTAFLVTSTISTPLYGKLSDIYGRKPLFLIAIVIFIAGSALCGLAQSMYMLAAFRAFQGLGAGGLFSLALAILADIVAPRERPRYMGYFMAVFATSSVLGPVVGGFLSGQSSILGITGWRWIFWVNVPIGFVALVVVTRVLHVPHARRNHRIDYGGATALILGLVPLLIIAEQGRSWGWASGAAFACYIIGGLGLVAFVWVESRVGDDALIPLRLFRNRNFAVGSAQSTVIGIAMFGGIASVPLYLQIVKGASPTKAGLLILPMVLGIMSASMVAGQITAHTGKYKIFPVLGSLALVAGLLLLHTVGADTVLWRTDVYMALFGIGLGLNMQTVVMAMQNAVPVQDMGVTTSSVTFFRQVGGTIGTAVFLSILFSTAGNHIATQLAKAHVPLQQVSGFSLNDTSRLGSLPTAVKHPILVGFSQAMDLVFLVGAAVAVVAVVLSWFIEEVPLRQMSGLDTARSEAAAAPGAFPAESVQEPAGQTSAATPSSRT